MHDIICRRDDDGTHVNIDQKIIRHSPTGFEWGYAGSGPADLALNILAEFIGRDRAEANGLYELFKTEFILPMPHEGGIITAIAIERWILRNEIVDIR